MLMVSKLILPGGKASRVESKGKGAVETCFWEFRWNKSMQSHDEFDRWEEREEFRNSGSDARKVVVSE